MQSFEAHVSWPHDLSTICRKQPKQERKKPHWDTAHNNKQFTVDVMSSICYMKTWNFLKKIHF